MLSLALYLLGRSGAALQGSSMTVGCSLASLTYGGLSDQMQSMAQRSRQGRSLFSAFSGMFAQPMQLPKFWTL